MSKEGYVPTMSHPFTNWNIWEATPFTNFGHTPSAAAKSNGFWRRNTGKWNNIPNEFLSEMNNMQERGFVRSDGTLNPLGQILMESEFKISPAERVEALNSLIRNGEYTPLQTVPEVKNFSVNDMANMIFSRKLTKLFGDNK